MFPLRLSAFTRFTAQPLLYWTLAVTGFVDRDDAVFQFLAAGLLDQSCFAAPFSLCPFPCFKRLILNWKRLIYSWQRLDVSLH